VAANDVVLQVTGLTGPDESPVIFDVSLNAWRARTSVVLGPIHSGKSIVMRHLLALEDARTGSIVVEGERFDARGESDAVVRRMRTRFGVIFEGAALLSRLTVLENVELPLLEHTHATGEEAREAAQELLSEVGLAVAQEATPGELDRAAQRRVALARALALRPPVLLLDEPTQGLDAHAASELDRTLREMQERGGFGIVIFTREARYAFGNAKRVYVMAEGRIVDEGDHTSLVDSEHPVVRGLLRRRGSE
jgi:phospholipid/cholesterol/gamma-HCH transport system ATP-binding protein